MGSRRLVRRLEALEGGYRRPCPGCGFSEVSDWSKITPQVVWEEEDGGPDYCPECGRALVINVVWEDSPEAPA